MVPKTVRIPEAMLRAVRLVERKERIEESTAIRKLLWAGLESYVARLYRHGEMTLREAARSLGLSQSETMDILLDAGVRGNLDAADVCRSIDRFVKP
jgi:Arc/MetJ-type ribon-helix-helix transcriptional regulator